MKKLALVLLLLPTLAWAQLPTTYVAGEMDVVTPAIRLLEVDQRGNVTFELSEEFNLCEECATSLPEGYGQEGQVADQGHVHLYFRRIKDGIKDDRKADVFCAFNIGNPPELLYESVWVGSCSQPDKGKYLVCVVVETNDHTQRVKAHPRDFPPVDCVKHKQRRKR